MYTRLVIRSKRTYPCANPAMPIRSIPSTTSLPRVLDFIDIYATISTAAKQ